MAKAFKLMNKEELVKATQSLGLMDKVVAIAKDPSNITNAEYVTVLEEFKASQDEINKDTKEEIEGAEKKAQEEAEKVAKENSVAGAKGATVIPNLKETVDQHKKAELKKIKYKYIVTDHQHAVQIDDDDETRTFPIQYGNLTTGPKNWNVGLHGNPQALPFSVAKKLESIQMIAHTKNGAGEPIAKSQPRFRVTLIDGWTEDEILALQQAQNTRKFKD